MSYIRHDYDPVKAHMYYINNRELKGRKKGEPPPPARSKQGNAQSPSGGNRSGAATQHPIQLQPHRVDPKAATEIRVKALKARLESLKKELKVLVAQAKAKSGVAPAKGADAKKPDAKAQSGNSKEKPKTASEKEKAAKAAKEYYDKLHPEAALLTQIASVQKRIDNARQKLEKSVQTARGKAAVQFVSKRPTG